MTKTAVISARIDPGLKQNVEQILDDLGLNMTQAITLFFKQVELQQGLPFEVRIPNEITRAALEDARARHGLTAFQSAQELFDDLGI